MPVVSIVIVNYNGARWVQRCIESIRLQSYDDIEVIVVDNNSTDNSMDLVAHLLPNAKIIGLEKNAGFGAANNIGARCAVGSVLLFLNTDTYFEADLIHAMLKCKRLTKSNILGPMVLDFEGVDHYDGKFLSIDVYGYLGWGKNPFFIEGSALMINKDDFMALGGFDEKYFMYSEDIDLCWRALLSGMQIDLCNTARLYHYGGGSSTKSIVENENQHVVPYLRRYEVEKNNLRNLLKNYQLGTLLWAVPAFLLGSLFELFGYFVTGNFKAAGMIVRAVYWNIKNIKDTIAHRTIVQNRRLVDDKMIMRRMTGFFPNKLKALAIVGLPRFR